MSEETINKTYEEVVALKDLFLRRLMDDKVKTAAMAQLKEQNELLIATMKTHGYNKDNIVYQIVKGYGHAGYVDVKDENGNYPYAKRLDEFMKRI